MAFKVFRRSPQANKNWGEGLSIPTTALLPQHLPFLVSSKCFGKLLVVLPSVNQDLTHRHFPAFRPMPHMLYGSFSGGIRSGDELRQTPTMVSTAYNQGSNSLAWLKSLFYGASPLTLLTHSIPSSSTPVIPEPRLSIQSVLFWMSLCFHLCYYDDFFFLLLLLKSY